MFDYFKALDRILRTENKIARIGDKNGNFSFNSIVLLNMLSLLNIEAYRW